MWKEGSACPHPPLPSLFSCPPRLVHLPSFLPGFSRNTAAPTCPDLGVGILAAAHAAHTDDGQLAAGQGIHVSQHAGGHIKQRPPAQATRLFRSRGQGQGEGGEGVRQAGGRSARVGGGQWGWQDGIC